MLRKLLIYLTIMGASMAFFGIFMLVFANSVSISCIRPPGRNPVCKIHKALLGTIPISTRVVADVTDVQEDESCDDSCSYRALLIDSTGDSYPVNDVYTDEGPVLEQMDGLKSFLEGSATTYDHTEPVPWWVVALLGTMAAVEVGILGVNFVRQMAAG